MLFNKIRKTMSKSFLFRLLLCFITIIAIISTFQIITYSLYIRRLERDAAHYINTNLKISSDNFSRIVREVDKDLLELYMDEVFSSLRTSNSIGMYTLSRTIDRLIAAKNNHSGFVKDIFLFDKNSDYVATCDGSFTKDRFFVVAYQHGDYDLSFWDDLCGQKFYYMNLPYRIFKSTSKFYDEKYYLMPIVYKPIMKSDFLFVALLDMNKFLSSIEYNMGKDFYIYDKESLLYPEVETAGIGLREIPLKEEQPFEKVNGIYYFTQYSEDSDLYFRKTLSYKEIKNDLVGIRMLFITAILVSIVLSFLISIALSVRVNRPIHRIVEHISGNQSFTELNTGINELDFINKNVQKLIVENSRISEDQNMKDSLLKKYFYITKLKNIYTDFGEIKQYILNNKYFSLMYFIIHYKESFYRIGDDLNKATFFITKLIQSIIGGKYPESLTFQIELNKVVSIISFNRSSMDVCALENALLERLESENEYMFLTVVRGSVYKDISQISSAYNEIFHISNQRKLNQETQILTPESLQGEHNRFHLTNDHEKYFTNHLSNGEVDKCMDLVNRIIDINYHRDVRQSYFQRLSIYLVNKSVNIINSLKLNFSEPVDVEAVYDQINKCSMVAHFKNLFAEFLPKISKPILEHRKSQDYIRNYVTEYIDRHYSEDIYLDLLADNLNITSNYLSQHFKLATGLCFKEHLNNIRMNRARELLLNTDKKIKEISHEVGYRNENTFIRSFKKINGSAPGEFRKQSNVRMKLDILVGSHPGGAL